MHKMKLGPSNLIYSPSSNMQHRQQQQPNQPQTYQIITNFNVDLTSSKCNWHKKPKNLVVIVNFIATAATLLMNLICQQHIVQSASLVQLTNQHQSQQQQQQYHQTSSHRTATLVANLMQASGNQSSLSSLSNGRFVMLNSTSIINNINSSRKNVVSIPPPTTTEISIHKPRNSDQDTVSQVANLPPSPVSIDNDTKQFSELGISNNVNNGDGVNGSESSARNSISNGNSIESSALNYLQKYGYMTSNNAQISGGASIERNNLITEESFSAAIADFQSFAGLPATGFVDNQTLELMSLPRCGNSDKWQPQQMTSDLMNSVTSHTHHHQRQQSPQQQASANRSSIVVKRRRKRYALQGSKWRRQELTYRISQYPTRFSGKRHEVDGQIAKAFGIWSQVAPIDFIVKREGRVHIDIRFASGDHGDGDAFDGPGNTLAHAYFPQYGGDAHFDDQEYWTINSYAGTNIFQVAAHELGHSLGLGHSNVREALMAPFYQKYKPNFKLHPDDILAIQALYGEKPLLGSNDLPAPSSSLPAATTTTTTTSSTTTTTTQRPVIFGSSSGRYPIYKGVKPIGSDGTTSDNQPSSTTTTTVSPDADDKGLFPSLFPDLNTNGIGSNDNPNTGNGNGNDNDNDNEPDNSLAPGNYPADLCSDAKIDAITRTEDGSSYVFKGDYYWQLVQDGLAKGYPRRIDADWDGLPGKLDAALTWADGKTFFFKGNKYWRFRNRRRDIGYPKLISAGFAGIPNNIDAALVWSGNGRTYIFKGSEYWRFDSKSDPPVSSEYPRPIKVWSGLPDGGIDAAFKWENNVTYFFRSNQYYRFNDREFKVESRGRPSFPRPTAEWWFGCINSNLPQRALPLPSPSPLPTMLLPPRSSAGRRLDSRGISGQGSSIGHSSGPIASLFATGASSVQTPDLDDWSFLIKSDRPQTGHINDYAPPSSSMGTHVNDRGPLDDSLALPGGQAKVTKEQEDDHVFNQHHQQPANEGPQVPMGASRRVLATTTTITTTTTPKEQHHKQELPDERWLVANSNRFRSGGGGGLFDTTRLLGSSSSASSSSSSAISSVSLFNTVNHSSGQQFNLLAMSAICIISTALQFMQTTLPRTKRGLSCYS